MQPLAAAVLAALPPHRLSLVVPLYNEEESVGPLVTRVHEALAQYPCPWELLLVDDGSSDVTVERIEQAQREHGGHVRAVRLVRNFKQTAAMQAGMDRARGDVIVTLDGDLQNDPADIPLMLTRLDEGYDVVHGWRASRQDRFWSRRLPSVAANRLIRWVTGVKVHDLGCALRVIRRELAEDLPLEGDMHRFIAVLADARGARSCEVPVRHHARTHGRSKYGLSRTLKVMADLLVLSWFTRLSVPMVRFAIGAGLALLAAAAVAPFAAGVAALVGWGVSWGLTGLTTLACLAGG
ncbi:MAG: glycosyltransferase family 2 protein, partial [Betaproteobacteria bacterium]